MTGPSTSPELTPGASVDSVVALSTNLVQTVSDSSTRSGSSPSTSPIRSSDGSPLRLGDRRREQQALRSSPIRSACLPKPTRLASGNRIYAAHQPGVQRNDSAYVAPDDSEADQLLASVGYSVDAKGVVVSASGAPLVLVLTGPRGIPTIATAEREIQAELLQAGIELRISNVARAELLSSTLPLGRYQLAIAPDPSRRSRPRRPSSTPASVGPTPSPVGGTSPSLPSAVNRNRSYLARTETEPSAANASVVTRDVLGYADPVVVGIFAAAQSQLNAAADVGLYNQIDTLLWQDLPTLPLFQMPTALVRQVEIVNVSDTATPAGPMWNAEDWAIQVSPPPTTSTTIPGS